MCTLNRGGRRLLAWYDKSKFYMCLCSMRARVDVRAYVYVRTRVCASVRAVRVIILLSRDISRNTRFTRCHTLRRRRVPGDIRKYRE